MALYRATQWPDAADVRGCYVKPAMDGFQWSFGYDKRLGLYFVDYKTLERMVKPFVTPFTPYAKNGAPKFYALDSCPFAEE